MAEQGAALLGQNTQLLAVLGLQQPGVSLVAPSMQPVHAGSSKGMPPKLYAVGLGPTAYPQVQAAFLPSSMLLPTALHGQLAAALAAASAGGSSAPLQHRHMPMAKPSNAQLVQQVGMQLAAACEAAGGVQPDAVQGQQMDGCVAGNNTARGWAWGHSREHFRCQPSASAGNSGG